VTLHGQCEHKPLSAVEHIEWWLAWCDCGWSDPTHQDSEDDAAALLAAHREEFHRAA
jgi:hypothetical protein